MLYGLILGSGDFFELSSGWFLASLVLLVTVMSSGQLKWLPDIGNSRTLLVSFGTRKVCVFRIFVFLCVWVFVCLCVQNFSRNSVTSFSGKVSILRVFPMH